MSSSGEARRAGDDEKRKVRTTNLSDSAFRTPAARIAELLLREVASRLTVGPAGSGAGRRIRDPHAARVVDQEGEEVLLRDRRLDDEHRPEEADGEQAR